jgi:signal transduction histidine kinase
MLFLNLRWLLFGCLLIVVAVTLLAVRSDRWRRQKRATAFLDSEEMLAVLEQAPFGWLVLEKPYAYRYANPYARRLLELSSPAGPLPEATWAHLLEDSRAIARQEPAATGSYHQVSLPSDRVIRWWVTQQGRLDVVFLLDATTQQRAGQAAEYLLGALSHELRTPIATLLTHLEILLLPDISTEIGQQSLHILKAETRRMARLVNQMLELSRLETSAEIERRPVDLPSLVEQAIAQVAPQAKEREIVLSFQADTPLPIVVGQADRLVQVFLNLLDNGVKYSRPGDQVVVSLRRREQGVECAVRDTGPGIPGRHLPHVTRRFYRAAPQEIEGSGLGLALVEEILRRHGSRLEITSRAEGEETGTCVSFVLSALEGDVA